MYESLRVWAGWTGHNMTVVSANDHIHSRASAHYEDRALDVHGTGLDEYNEWMLFRGFQTYWMVPGHWQHAHAEWPINLEE